MREYESLFIFACSCINRPGVTDKLAKVTTSSAGWGVTADVSGVSFRGDASVLELGSGDGCPAECAKPHELYPLTRGTVEASHVACSSVLRLKHLPEAGISLGSEPL